MATNKKNKSQHKELFRIGDIAERISLEAHVLRYWEKEFKDFLDPIKIGSRKRLYTLTDLETFSSIKHLLYHERFTLDGARKQLANFKPKSNTLFDDPPKVVNSDTKQDATKELEELKSFLGEVRLELLNLREYLLRPRKSKYHSRNLL
ncbi:MAG: MerR family transcriptional regulator [Deltaproteobacteria bacterium]|jgi:DNA-binding transcriptional MerR regulator|nr:MerR family transcriptional regulator [Deltaproteobacteria bacterium]